MRSRVCPDDPPEYIARLSFNQQMVGTEIHKPDPGHNGFRQVHVVMKGRQLSSIHEITEHSNLRVGISEPVLSPVKLADWGSVRFNPISHHILTLMGGHP